MVNLADADNINNDVQEDDKADKIIEIKPGAKLEVKIVNQGKKGDGIGYYDGFTIFVPGAPLGITAKIKIDDVRDKNAWAHLHKTEVQSEVRRVYLPKKDELFGVVTQRLGFKRMYVLCEDGNVRVTRTPGRKRRLWIREGDTVVVKPWVVQGDEKADVIHKYRIAEVDFLRRKKYLDKIDALQ